MCVSLVLMAHTHTHTHTLALNFKLQNTIDFDYEKSIMASKERIELLSGQLYTHTHTHTYTQTLWVGLRLRLGIKQTFDTRGFWRPIWCCKLKCTCPLRLVSTSESPNLNSFHLSGP